MFQTNIYKSLIKKKINKIKIQMINKKKIKIIRKKQKFCFIDNKAIFMKNYNNIFQMNLEGKNLLFVEFMFKKQNLINQNMNI